MIEAPLETDEGRLQRTSAIAGRRWLRTFALGVAFLVLALLAEVAGLAHEETVPLARQGLSATSRPGTGATRVADRVIAVAARPLRGDETGR